MNYKKDTKHKIQDFNNVCYTAKIIEDDGKKIYFLDRDNLECQLDKEEIKKSREVKE